MEPSKDLEKLVKEIKPHVLIGTSTVGGAFTEKVIKAMVECNDRPVIFPLSNPTKNSECTAEEAYKWTNVSHIRDYLMFFFREKLCLHREVRLTTLN
jgi:malic enzyme